MARRQREDEALPKPFLRQLLDRVKAHNLPIFAAAVAFFSFVAMVPALVATVSITGLVADTDDLISEAESVLEGVPDSTKRFLLDQLHSIADSDSTGVGIAAVVGIALAVFSASSAVGNLMTALNYIYERSESRNFVVKRLTAIGLLLGAILGLAAMVFTLGVLPELLSEWEGSALLRFLVTVSRFAGLAVIMVVGLGVLYRLGPTPRPSGTYELVPGGRWEMFTIGAAVGTGLFVVLSWGFSIFVRNFGSYNETYGALAGIIVLLLWLQLASLAVLVGAEINAVRKERRIDRARLEAGLKPRSEVETT